MPDVVSEFRQRAMTGAVPIDDAAGPPSGERSRRLMMSTSAAGNTSRRRQRIGDTARRRSRARAQGTPAPSCVVPFPRDVASQAVRHQSETRSRGQLADRRPPEAPRTNAKSALPHGIEGGVSTVLCLSVIGSG